jgi:E3 ubiquitin-protein ligase DOA10
MDNLMTGWISDFMNHPATYLKSGWLQISVSNLIVIVLMLTIFALAVFVSFPKDKEDHK